MRDLLAAVVSQQQDYSRRLERIEEEQAMRSAASGRTALDAKVDDQLGATASKGPNEGREARDVSGVSAERAVTRGSGDRLSQTLVAQAPTATPGGATGCQYFYIGDSLPPSREEGHATTMPVKVHEQPRLTESDLLGRILGMPDDEMRVVKRRIESQSKSDVDRMFLWREYFLQKDKLGNNSGYGMAAAGVGQSSFETPTLAGGGLPSVHRHELDMSGNAVQTPLQQTQTGLSHQGEKRGRFDHEGLPANFRGVASGTPHCHSSSIGSVTARPEHGLMAESLVGFPGFGSGGVVERAGALGCNDFSLTAAQGPMAELQVPVSMRACEHDSHMRAYAHDSHMRACAHDSHMSHACRPNSIITATTTTPLLLSDAAPRNPFDPLPQGCMGIWEQGSRASRTGATNEVQARPQVSVDPQQGMLRPARGPEDLGGDCGQGPVAVGRPEDQQQRGLYNPGDNVLGSSEIVRLGSESSSVASGGLGCNHHSDDGRLVTEQWRVLACHIA